MAVPSQIEPGRKGHGAAVAGDRVEHEELEPYPVEDEDASVAAAEQPPAIEEVVGADRQGEALGGDAVGRAEDRGESDVAGGLPVDAEDGGLPVVGAEAAAEVGGDDEAAPEPGDDGDAGERGGLRGRRRRISPSRLLESSGAASAGERRLLPAVSSPPSSFMVDWGNFVIKKGIGWSLPEEGEAAQPPPAKGGSRRPSCRRPRSSFVMGI
jgi:hypothetical protein